MIKVKDGYIKLVGTSYLGSTNSILRSDGNIWEVHTGRNNEVNKIVRTDSNGFLLTGWINTTSGDTGTNTINKIYCSNDGYIRYKTPANFFSSLANSGDNISITVASLNRTLKVLYANIAGLLRSKGTIAPLTGRTLSLGDVYSYHLNASVSGGPTTYAAVIGFGKGTSGTVEIAGEWTNGRGVWVRALRDVTDNWYSWDKILTLATYTGITDSRYYTKTLSDDRFVNITGDTMTGELSNSSSNAYRLIRTNYGVILRNDDSSFHILLTNSGSPTGSFNSLRPFSIALSSGRVSLGNGLTVSGTISGNNTITGTLLISTIANGTSPLLVTSRTLVSNLNADLLDGFNSTDFLRLYKISNVDTSTLYDTLLYWTDTDANSGTLTNAPFTLSHAILLVKNYINDTDYRRSRLAFDAYGNLKTFNDRGTTGNSGVWYTVLTNSNYSSIINNNYYTKTESDNRYLLKGSAVNSNNNASWLSFANDSGGIGGTMGSNDFWRIYGRSTAGNAGYLEIATADDSNEPIYVRLYTGVFSTLKRTLVLLDGSGNSIFPGRIKVSNSIESSLNTATFLLGNKGYALISSTASAGAYVMLHRGNSTNGYFTIGTYLDKYLLQYTKSTTVTNDSNTVDKLLILLNEGGNSSFPGTVSVSGSINSNSTNGILIPNNSSKVTKTSSNWIHGGVDSCSNSDANLRFGSWYGIGWYPTISGQTVALGMNAMWLNVRTGVLLVANEVKSIKFTGALVGNADSATKLTSNAGNRILPVYFSDGKPVACSFLYYYTFNNNNIPYIKLFTLKITGAYINTPITFNIKGRSGREAFIAIKFSNVSTTDPTITYFKGWGGYSGYYTRLRICKTDTSTWEIWKMSLVEGYDSGYIWDMLVPGGITFTWNNTTSSTEPTYTTYTNCTIETLFANISGNSATSDKWKTARSITLGNYLSGSTTLDGSSNVTLNATVKGLTSLGNKTAISGTTIPESGLRMYLVYDNGYPCTFGNLISAKGSGSGELLLQWQGSNNPGHIFYRSKRDTADSIWSNWVLVLDSSNYSSIISNNYWKVNLLTTTGTGDIYLEMWRGTNASWKILSSGGNLYFLSNYTNAVGNYYNVLTLNYNSGNATVKGIINAAHFYENSDVRLKHNIELIHDSNNIPEIKLFDWKESREHSYGLIALELELNGYSELVETKEDGYKSVNYSAALSLIIGKLQVKIRELEKEIENLKIKS